MEEHLFFEEFNKYHKNNPQLRKGQAMYVFAKSKGLDLSEIVGTTKDCYYNDGSIKDFIDYLRDIGFLV